MQMVISIMMHWSCFFQSHRKFLFRIQCARTIECNLYDCDVLFCCYSDGDRSYSDENYPAAILMESI